MAPPPIPLTKGNYALAVKWDCLDGRGVDLDLQAVIVDDRGLIVDAAYYNNVAACNGAVTLSGDEQTGSAGGYDESMWINLLKLPSKVRMIIFVLAVYGDGRLKDVDNGQLTILEEGRALRIVKMERSLGNCDLVAVMRKTRAGWELIEVDEPAEFGSHFLDILEPTIGDLIRKEIPDAPKFLKVSFEMTKGSVCPLPMNSALKRVFVGIGGTLLPGTKKQIDIDISAVFVSTEGKILGAVDADHESLYGVSHSGDEVAGTERGCGDDEAISIDLAHVPEKIASLWLVLSVRNGTFSQVRRAYARIIDQTATELVRYDVTEKDNRSSNGLIIAKLARTEGRRWGFAAIGNYYTSSNKSWRGASERIVEMVKQEKEAENQSLAVRSNEVTRVTRSTRIVEDATASGTVTTPTATATSSVSMAYNVGHDRSTAEATLGANSVPLNSSFVSLASFLNGSEGCEGEVPVTGSESVHTYRRTVRNRTSVAGNLAQSSISVRDSTGVAGQSRPPSPLHGGSGTTLLQKQGSNISMSLSRQGSGASLAFSGTGARGQASSIHHSQQSHRSEVPPRVRKGTLRLTLSQDEFLQGFAAMPEEDNDEVERKPCELCSGRRLLGLCL